MLYADALAVYAALDRLVMHDDQSALIRFDMDERELTRAQVCTSAALVLRGNPDLTLPSETEGNGDAGSDDEDSDCDAPVASSVGEEAPADESPDVDSIASDDDTPIQSEQEDKMNRHKCNVTGKEQWAGQDGHCYRCRPVSYIEGEPLTQDDLEQIYAPTLADLIDQIGGEPALELSIAQIIATKQAGRSGLDVRERKTRELLDLIMQQDEMVQGAILEEYRVFLTHYGITFHMNTDGVYVHDYQALGGGHTTVEQVALPGMEAPTGWQAVAADYYAKLNAAREAKRAVQQIVMVWYENDVRKQTTLGANDEETRKLAAEYLAASRKKEAELNCRFRVSFELA